MNKLALTLAGALTVSSGVAAAQSTVGDILPFNGEIVSVGTIDAATGILSPRANSAVGLGMPIYNNTSIPVQGSFFTNIGANIVVDEGRIPSTSSPDVVGLQDSYDLSALNLQYVTDATDPSLGGTGITIELNIYESYAACTAAGAAGPALATITLPGLPGSTSGGLGGFSVNVDLTSLGICIRGDGDGAYSDGASDLFGWSFQVIDPADATASGPFIRADPDVVPAGDGTVFQNAGATSGTGLGTLDLFARTPAAPNCIFFGGYPANLFASFQLVLFSDLTGDCIGCGLGDDRFEPNDDVTTAAAIPSGAFRGLVSDVNEDWFSYTISPGANLTVDALFVDAVSDLDLRIYDATGATQLDSSNSGSDDEQVTVGNCDTVNGLDVTIQILNFSGVCNEYDLILTEAPLAADDAFEDNDTCADRVPLPLGVTRGLVVRPYCGTGTTEDSDYYTAMVNPGETINVDVLFTDAITDIDVVLYDLTAGCPGTSVATGFTTTDNESVEWTNTTAAAVEIAVRVDYFNGDVGIYDMIATIGVNKLGEVICLGLDNSTGTGARLCATGDPAAAANDLTLDVTDLPLNSLGYFIVSQDVNLVVNPGGSQGNLCIASLMIGRYANDVLDSGATGAVTFSPDLTVIPIASGGGTGTSAAMAGDTYNFQFWNRDVDGMGGATSNFSDALSITFE